MFMDENQLALTLKWMGIFRHNSCGIYPAGLLCAAGIRACAGYINNLIFRLLKWANQ